VVGISVGRAGRSWTPSEPAIIFKGALILPTVRRVPRTFAGRLAVVAALGLGLRGAYLYGLARDVVGIGDWWFYHWQARLIAQGHGFTDPWLLLSTHHYRPSAMHPPLYPLLLSGPYLLGAHSALDQRSLGLLLGALTLVLVGLLGRRVGGDRLGLLSAVLYAVYPVMIAADGDLMSEVLYSPLIAAMLLTAFAVADSPSLRGSTLLGILIGLAALTRTEALLFLPFLVVPVAWRAREGWRGRGAVAGAALLGCVVVITPWLIRDQLAFGRFVLISTNNATVIAGANCAKTYHGVNTGAWDITCISARTKANEAAQAAIWQHQGLSYAAHHLSRLPAVVLLRELRVWDLWQPRRQARTFAEGQQIGVAEAGVAVFWILGVIGIAGVLALRRHRPALLVLLAPAPVVCVSTAIGYGVPRLRDSFDVALPVLAAAGALAVRHSLAELRRAPKRFAAGSQQPAA
jgi:4-amino-4-deoxy-L-arabinose transferase-like glycosyltransferase